MDLIILRYVISNYLALPLWLDSFQVSLQNNDYKHILAAPSRNRSINLLQQF